VKYSLKGILIDIPPLEKGGEGGFENLCNVDMLPYNKSLKELSGNLRRNITDAEILKQGDAVLEKIWSRLYFIKSPLTPLCQRGVNEED
jgi:hypothetical protein